jgi:Flp pilus assembly protein TadG
MRSPERGSALLEFGLLATVLFMLIFGIIDFGRALFAYHFVANAAREGTRYASVRGASCSLPMTDCGANNLQTYLQNEATGIGMNPSQLNVQATYPIESDSPAVCSTVSNNPGCTVQVVVSYPFSFVFPLLPASTLNVSSTSATITER